MKVRASVPAVPYYIAVVSYNRPNWITLDYLDKQKVPRYMVHLVLHNEEQVRLYEKARDLQGLNLHVSSNTDGLRGQLNWTYRKFAGHPLLVLDDDISSLKRVRGLKNVVEADFLWEMDHAFKLAQAAGCRVFGVSALQNIAWALEKPAITVGKPFVGALRGFTGEWQHEVEAYMGEDSELGLAAIRAGVGPLTLQRLIMKVGRFSPGGCYEDWKRPDLYEIHRDLALKYRAELKTFGLRHLKLALTCTKEEFMEHARKHMKFIA